MADSEIKREKFKKLASARTQKLRDMIKLLGNLSNTYAYEYTQEEVNKIFNTLEKDLKDAKAKFKTDKRSDEKFSL